MIRHCLTALTAVTLLTYPFAVYFGLQTVGLKVVGGFLALLFVARILFASRTGIREFRAIAMIAGFTGLLLISAGLFFRQQGWLTFYPVAVNIVMLMVFASSLFQRQTVIERLARLQEPDLPPSAVQYTRKVTQIWCLYFIANGSVALYTCFQPLQIWALYNGLLSYIIAGILFASEWLIRQHVRKRDTFEKNNCNRRRN